MELYLFFTIKIYIIFQNSYITINIYVLKKSYAITIKHFKKNKKRELQRL